jgi:hypothetical protein
VSPSNWDKPAVKALLAAMPGAPAPAADMNIPSYFLEAKTNDQWQKYTLECPCNGIALEGYYLSMKYLSPAVAG